MALKKTQKEYYDEYGYPGLYAAAQAYEAANNPGAYSRGALGDQVDAAWSAYLNRPKFSYDPGKDALYKGMRSTAINEGRRASADVMGQAAQLTGGYGNSYAASAAAQAYQNRLTQLANQIPELYQLAAARYDQESGNLLNNYNALRQQESDQYGRWMDQNNLYNNQLSRLYGLANDAYSKATDAYNADYQRDWQQQQFDYQKEQDAIANSQKWASMAQSNNEAALKAQIADLNAQVAELTPGLKMSESTKKNIQNDIIKKGYNQQEALNYLYDKYGDYDEEVIKDILRKLYGKSGLQFMIDRDSYISDPVKGIVKVKSGTPKSY